MTLMKQNIIVVLILFLANLTALGMSAGPQTCTDGFKTQDEIYADCGGVCRAANCSNGIQDCNETSIDCGGICDSLHCFNGIQDCGETAIDCGPACASLTCTNNVQDCGESSAIDCGFPCSPCFKACDPANLVRNCSFENYSLCPTTYTGITQNAIARAISWDYPTTGTSDFHHTCSDFDPSTAIVLAGVPYNDQGFQYPRTGKGYAAILNYVEYISDYNEYIQAALLSPLVAGVSYDVSFYLSLAENGVSSDGIGAYFSSTRPTSPSYLALPFVPQTGMTPVISDKIGWTQFSASFIAAGGEQWITLGGFLDDASMTIVPTSFPNEQSYYYIDDICVSVSGSGPYQS